MKKLGLALGSGGGRGMFHLGVFKALQENDLYPEVVVGSSIGSFMGGLWSKYQDYEKIMDVLKDDKMLATKALFDPAFFAGGLIKGESMQEVLLDLLGTDSFEDLKVKFAAVSCDLRTGKEFIWKDGSLSKAIRASMSIPGTFTPVEYEDMLLADGGVVNPVPDDVVKSMGADVVVSCNLDYRVNEIMASEDLKRIDKAVYRMLNIMRHYLADYSMNNSDVVLNPAIDDDGMISLEFIFNKDKKVNLIDLGYNMMQGKIGEIKDLLAS